MTETDRPKDRLPTKEQIVAISSIPDLEALRDEIDRRCARIETDLDFRDGTTDWEARALAALSIHRYTGNLISRRIAGLRKTGSSPFSAAAKAQVSARERTDCRPLSWKLIEGDVSADAGDTAEGIDAAVARLTEAIDALELDRADEVGGFVAGARDEAWLSEANAALKRAKAARHALSIRRSELRRAEKAEQQRATDRERERVFIEEARAVLPRATFLMIWDRADRRFAEEQAIGTQEMDQAA